MDKEQPGEYQGQKWTRRYHVRAMIFTYDKFYLPGELNVTKSTYGCYVRRAIITDDEFSPDYTFFTNNIDFVMREIVGSFTWKRMNDTYRRCWK